MHRRRAQGGFSVLTALISVIIVTIVALAALGGLSLQLQKSRAAEPALRTRDDLQNLSVRLSAVATYDRGAVAASSGGSTLTIAAPQPAPSTHLLPSDMIPTTVRIQNASTTQAGNAVNLNVSYSLGSGITASNTGTAVISVLQRAPKFGCDTSTGPC